MWERLAAPQPGSRARMVESAILLGGPSCLLAEGRYAEGERGHVGAFLVILTSSAISHKGAISLLIGNPKESESVLVIRVQGGDDD